MRARIPPESGISLPLRSLPIKGTQPAAGLVWCQSRGPDPRGMDVSQCDSNLFSPQGCRASPATLLRRPITAAHPSHGSLLSPASVSSSRFDWPLKPLPEIFTLLAKGSQSFRLQCFTIQPRLTWSYAIYDVGSLGCFL